ncbi:hypothetical protein HTV45_28380 [Streptomyces sp. CHD11]|uniref:hypothetical protein n=1 Tax=Streptomyces sp. CHD11 TaxID=2741325 RepID=UPI001BFBF9E1|nr:hypothetical protein [Streptomyces sp. CHD11]MBT3154742.1 hypothetical protein [Streptomyces sp. CHD11]
MQPRGNTLKLTAVSALVVLTLTGFSAGRGHGGSSGDGGGGGCSSSGQNHDSSGSGGGSHRDDDDDDDDYGADDSDYGSDSGGTGDGGVSDATSELDARVDLVDCASPETPYATVDVTNQNATAGVFTVTVRFEDATGAEVVTRTRDVAVPGSGTVPVRVDVDADQDVSRIAACDPGMFAPAVT